MVYNYNCRFYSVLKGKRFIDIDIDKVNVLVFLCLDKIFNKEKLCRVFRDIMKGDIVCIIRVKSVFFK